MRLARPSTSTAPSNHRPLRSLENNPEVFSHLVQQLGVSPKLTFHDVYSTSDPTLLSLIPRPCHALLCICPAAVFAAARDAENASMGVYDGSGAAEPVIWYRQTIGNSCGLVALLHGVSNGGARRYILPGSDLEALVAEAVQLKPAARARLLYDSAALEAAHASAAGKGDTRAPGAREWAHGFHYVCFVKGDDGRMWELNGGMKGPVDRGLLGEDEDALSERALKLGVGSFLSRAGVDDLAFSIVAIAAAEE